MPSRYEAALFLFWRTFMKKKLTALILGLSLMATSAFGVVGCNNGNGENTGDSGNNTEQGGELSKDEYGTDITFKGINPSETTGSAKTTSTYSLTRATLADSTKSASFDKYRNETFYAHVQLENPNHYKIQRIKISFNGKQKNYLAYNFDENSNWENVYIEIPSEGVEDISEYKIVEITYLDGQGKQKKIKIKNNDSFNIKVLDIRPAEIINAPAFTEKGDSYCMTNYNEQYVDANGKLTIPSVYKGKPVTSIGEHAFTYCENIKEVVIPDSITEVGANAFYDCLNLEKVEIGTGVTHFGLDAFHGCANINYVNYTGTLNGWFKIMFGYTKQEQVNREMTGYTKNPPKWDAMRGTNPLEYSWDLHVQGNIVKKITAADLDGIDHISDMAFVRSYALESIQLSDDVITVGCDAFNGAMGVSTIDLGNSVQVLGRSSFRSLYGVTELELPRSLQKMNGTFPFGALNKCYLITNNSQVPNSNIFNGIADINKDLLAVNGWNNYGQAINNKYETDSDGFVWLSNSNASDKIYLVGYVGSKKEITIPTTYNGKNVVLAECAFASNMIVEKITLPEYFTEIPPRFAVGSLSIKEVICLGKIATVGNRAFHACTVEKVTFEKGCDKLDEALFRQAIAETVTVTIKNSTNTKFDKASLAANNNLVLNYAGTVAQYIEATENAMGISNVYENLKTAKIQCTDGLYEPTKIS